MPSGFTQDNRFLKLTTPLGADVLLIESFTVSEHVSDNIRNRNRALGGSRQDHRSRRNSSGQSCHRLVSASILKRTRRVTSTASSVKCTWVRRATGFRDIV